MGQGTGLGAAAVPGEALGVAHCGLFLGFFGSGLFQVDGKSLFKVELWFCAIKRVNWR